MLSVSYTFKVPMSISMIILSVIGRSQLLKQTCQRDTEPNNQKVIIPPEVKFVDQPSSSIAFYLHIHLAHLFTASTNKDTRSKFKKFKH